MSHRTLAVVALAACAGVLAAQQNIVWHDDSSPITGAVNAYPFGVQGVRTQQLIPQSVLGASPVVIQDLFVNSQINSTTAFQVSQVWYGDFEIRAGTTQLTTLTTSWAANSPNATTVYRGPLLVRWVRDTWVALGLPQSFTWAPQSPADNLVLDFICWQVLDSGVVPPSTQGYFLNVRSSPSASISRAYRLGWTNGQPATAVGVDGYGMKLGFLLGDGNFVRHDGDCEGSSNLVPAIGAPPGTWPQAGQTFTVTMADGPANQLATLVLGVDTTSYGGLPLPLDLTIVGAPGCRMWHGWDVLLPIVPVDAAGAASAPLVFPAGVPTGTRLYATWLAFDPAANGFGFVPSGFATLIL
jgi:hypothetical protein